jgi:hypothetical protein
MMPDRAGIGSFLSLSATNHGPIKVILHSAVVRTQPDKKTGSRFGILNPLHNFPLQTNHTIGPFSGGLPKPLDVGETFSVYFPYSGDTFLAEDLRLIGFVDTFSKYHWASRRDLKNVLEKYRKQRGTVAPTNRDLQRADSETLTPEIT